MSNHTHNHGDLIKDLAKIIRPQLGLSHQRLYLWKKRGIPYAYRAEVAKIAAVHNKPIPEGFFDAPAKGRAA